MKHFRLFFTILFLLVSLITLLLFAIFDNTIFPETVILVKNYMWVAGAALLIFLILLTTGIVSNAARLESSLINNGYFQLAILELFLLSAGMTYNHYYLQKPGQIVFRIEPETIRDYINLAVTYKSSGTVSTDTVRAPGHLGNLPVGGYRIETLDDDIVSFSTDLVLKPGKTETVVIPVALNTRTLSIQTEPAGAEIWINGLQASKTPYTFNILVGDTVILNLKMPDYKEFTDTLWMAENIDLGTIALQKLYNVWISPVYADVGYRIYDGNKNLVFSSSGSRKIQLTQGRYRIDYEIGEGQYDTKWFSVNYNLTVTVP
jgi:hypothetical protein